MPSADITRMLLGYPVQPSALSRRRTRIAHVPDLQNGAKPMVVKVQVPFTSNARVLSTGDLLVYTRRRDFACVVRRSDGPNEYDRISEVIRMKGVGAAKAYFAAELTSKEKLVVKISEVLAEQPW